MFWSFNLGTLQRIFKDKLTYYNEEKDSSHYFPGKYNLIHKFGDDNEIKISITTTYFALTTLSSVGFGDFHPISSFERLFMVLIFLLGVNIFSYLLGIFIDILHDYKSLMTDVEDEDRLQGFFNILKLFNYGKSIDNKI